MITRFPLTRTVFLVIVAAWLAGCSSTQPSRFYILTPLVSPETKQHDKAVAQGLSINIAPVEIPDYLDRPQIVTRDGRNELHISEFDRWAGALDENISAVLAEDLALLLGTDRVFVNAGAPFGNADYTVAMRIVRLDCIPGDHALLKAQWTVFADQPDRKAATHFSTVTEKLSDKRYDTMVAAVNRALGHVNREIARTIGEAARKTPSPPQ